jgi:hypothetical protein
LEKGLEPLPSGPPPVAVFPDLQWAMSGFWRLSNARPAGFNGVLRIPFAEINAYCSLHGFDHSKTQDFLYYVENLDAKFMEFVKEKQEEEERKNQTANAAGKAKTGSRR